LMCELGLTEAENKMALLIRDFQQPV
jgi:hypothetical protein